MSKHTAGPWIIFKSDHGIDPYPGIDSEASPASTIIMFGDENESSGIRGKDRETRLANARLIAAAPDLLEALKFTADVIREWRETGNINYGHWNKAADQIEAAIKKASGE